MRVKYRCPNCNEPVLAARWEMGYTYCKKNACVSKLGRVKVPMYEAPPTPDTKPDLSPFELDDIAETFFNDSGD